LQWCHVIVCLLQRATGTPTVPAYGRCPTKQRTSSGYRLNLLITGGGAMLDVEVMRATADERDAACAMVETKRDGTVLGDTGFVKAE
jgi:hypothetical protein